MHSTKLLGDLTVSGDSPLDLWVVVDSVREDCFGQIEVDSQTDRDDT